jgi:hypothetical protein
MALAAGGELTILGGQASGDYGTETDNTRQSAAVRFTLGNETQLRIDFEFLRIDRALGVTQTSFGTIPTLHHQSSGMSGNPDSGQGPTGGTTGGTLPIDDPSPVTTTPEEDWATGIGDLRLSVSRLLMGGGAKLFRLDVQVGTKVPTADEQELLGTGEWDYRLGLAAQYRFWAMTGFGGLGWNVLGDPAWAELQDVADAYVGLESPPIGGKIIVSGWLEGNEEVIAGSGSRTALALSLRSTKNVRWQAQIRAGLGGSSEDLSALFGVSIGLSTPTVGSRRAG